MTITNGAQVDASDIGGGKNSVGTVEAIYQGRDELMAVVELDNGTAEVDVPLNSLCNS